MKVFHLLDADREERINMACEPGRPNFSDMLNRMCRDLPILPKKMFIPVVYGNGWGRSCQTTIMVTDRQIVSRWIPSAG